MSEQDEGNRLGSNPVVITPGTGNVYMGPAGTHIRAEDFLKAAELLRESAERFMPVAAFLCCRSVELALKAFLLARGETNALVRGFGHDLVQLLNEAHARGLDAVVSLNGDELAILRAANEDYMEHRLAYFDLTATISHYPKQPDPTALASVAAKLLAGVERGCYDASDGPWNPLAPPVPE
jgi:HEPN domain-containing protein